MDFDHGGPSSSERQRQTAAEIARKKVLAAYSSTVKNLKNLPPNAKDILLKNRENQVTPQPTSQPDWSTYQTAAYQRTPIYSQPSQAQTSSQASYTEPAYEQPSVEQTTYNLPENPNPPAATDSYEPTPETSAEITALKDAPVDQDAVTAEWQKYHSAWQDYYKNYYSEYYAKAAQTYLATEKLKNERVATGSVQRRHNIRRLIPIFVLIFFILAGLFMQYNRLIFAPLMAYISPDSGSVTSNIEPVDPTITQAVSPEPRLIIPKLNVDVPVAFNISTSEVDAAMNQGVAQFSIPGANALPGQIGNLVISGHSAGDIYSSNQYKFIFSGLERLENGDLIYINYNSVRYTYQMTGRETVEPSNVAALVYETDKPMLTLITCTPLGTSRYRLLISAEQISPSYADAEAQAPAIDTPTDTKTDEAMPANAPSFFESLWQGIFGS